MGLSVPRTVFKPSGMFQSFNDEFIIGESYDGYDSLFRNGSILNSNVHVNICIFMCRTFFLAQLSTQCISDFRPFVYVPISLSPLMRHSKGQKRKERKKARVMKDG